MTNPELHTTTRPRTVAEWYERLDAAINTAIFTAEDFREDGMKIIRAIQAQAYRRARKRG
jgi:hypothetical protein